MSNKIVPNIYRAVIDDVISAIKPEFDEFGVAEDVLAELQHVSGVFFLSRKYLLNTLVTPCRSEMGE
jgi:hypothetical protein